MGVYLLDFKNVYERYISIIIAVTSVVFLLGVEIIKSRLFFNLPIGILAALGFLYLKQRIKDKFTRYSLIVFTVTSMCVYLFQSLGMIVILTSFSSV